MDLSYFQVATQDICISVFQRAQCTHPQDARCWPRLGKAHWTGHGAWIFQWGSPYTPWIAWQSFSSLVSWPKLSSYYHWVLFYKFYFFQVKKGDLGAGMHGISWREKYLLRECRWLQNLFPPLPPLFHQKEYSPCLYTQTSVLKIAKFHLDCGGVKDRRQMHWLPARLDIHFFFPHPGSQQLHTRAQVRSLVVKPTVSASPSIH